jgi:NitT/TauT family transport system permease protein
MLIINIIFGLGFGPYVVTFMILFPIVYQGTLSGLDNISIYYIYLYKMDTPNMFRSIFRVYLPLIKKDLFTTLTQIIGLGIKAMIIDEYLFQTPNSIGNIIYQAKINFDYALVIGVTLLVLIVSILVEILPKFLKN